MTIFRTPYETTQCDGFELGVAKTQAQLKAANAMGALHYAAPAMVVVQDGDNFRNNIPGFVHPMLVDPKVNPESDASRPALATDVRPFGAWNRNQDAFIVRDKSQMDMAMLRLRLSSIWLTEERSYLRNLSPIPVKMFSSWISESLQRKFFLEPLEQMHLSVLAGILYNSNFTDAKELDEGDKVRLAGSLSRDLGIEVKEILPILDEYPVIHGVDEFCKAAAKLGGVRLAELNRGMLFACVVGSWYGYNYKEVMAVALEHPPTWLAVVFSAGTDRSYRATGLFKLFERSHRGGSDQLFFGGLRKLLDNFAPLNDASR
jgi:hypothetical protein